MDSGASRLTYHLHALPLTWGNHFFSQFLWWMFNGLLETFPYDITCTSRFPLFKEFVRLNSKHCVFISHLLIRLVHVPSCSWSFLLWHINWICFSPSFNFFFLLSHFFFLLRVDHQSFPVIPTSSYASLLSSTDSWHKILKLCPNGITNFKKVMSSAFTLENWPNYTLIKTLSAYATIIFCDTVDLCPKNVDIQKRRSNEELDKLQRAVRQLKEDTENKYEIFEKLLYLPWLT